MDKQEAKEFLPNNADGYQYGMFYQEVKSRYYISDETITYIISKINWELDDTEKAYLLQWRRFEEIHRDYCMNLLVMEEYKSLINNEYNNFADKHGYEFGECCDELVNHILRHLK